MRARRAIYLDWNAGSPLAPSVAEELASSFRKGLGSEDSPDSSPFLFLGNPSSTHAYGRELRAKLSQARQAVAQSLGLPPGRAEELVFTASGTEANQLPLQGFLAQAKSWAVGQADHPSVRAGLRAFAARGGRVQELPVEADGRTRVEELVEGTDVLSLLWANNETGSVLELERAVSQARARGVRWLHVDAAQAWGKLPVDLSLCGADAVSFSGHKVGALPGSGVVWLSPRARAELRPRHPWPSRTEGGLRPGTENIWAAVALGAAARAVDVASWQKACAERKAHLKTALRENIPQIVWNAQSDRPEALANTLNFRVPGAERPGWVAALDLRGFAVSAGAACSAGAEQPSHVLLACGLTEAQAKASVRVSWGPTTPLSHLDAFVQAVVEVAQAFR